MAAVLPDHPERWTVHVHLAGDATVQTHSTLFRSEEVSEVSHRLARLKQADAPAAHHEPCLCRVPAVGLVCAICGGAGAAPLNHRPLTVLFCDVVGSAALTGKLELEAVRTLIHSWQHTAATTIEAQGGFVARFMGDGILAYFGYPDAQEDDAERAVDAGFALLDEAGKITTPLPLRLRIGIASGPVIVERSIGSGISHEIPVYGIAPNLAARLLERAPPGGMVIDERTRAALGGLFAFKPLGAQPLKGFSRGTAAFQVSRPDELSSRFVARRATRLTRFVGRELELAALLKSVEGPAEAGLRLVLVTGEAGVGKSRLLHEMAEHQRARGRPLLHGDCSPSGRDAPFAPIVDAFRRALPLDAARQADDIGTAAVALAREEASGEDMAQLLGLLRRASAPGSDVAGSPLLLRGRIHALLHRMLAGICGRHEAGALLVLEDVHSIDQSTREFLAELHHVVGALPLVVVMSSRTASPLDWLPAELAGERLRRLELASLSRAETARLLEGRSGAGNIAPASLNSIVDRSGGNPLFAEELLSLLLEAETPSDSAGVPDSVTQITASRLDQLNAGVRHVLNTAAVVGVRFPLHLLAEVLTLPQDELRTLLEGQTRDLVHPLAGQSNQYVFRHALIQEAVCASLLPSGRRRAHAQIAEVLERQGGAEVHAESLAHHYHEAGAPLRAVESLLAAGNKRLAIYALDEADQCFLSALELVEPPGSPAQALLAGVLAKRMRLLELRGAFGEIVALAERVLPLLDRQAVSPELCLVLANYAHALLHGHHYLNAERVAVRALTLSRSLNAALPGALAQLVRMKVASAVAGDADTLPDIERMAAEIVATAELARDSYLACAARFQLAIHHLTDGDLSRARGVAADLERQGERFSDPRAQSFAQWLVGWILLQDLQFEAAMALAEQSLHSAVTDVDRTVGIGLKGALLALTGRPQEALALLLPTHADVTARGDLNHAAAIEPAIGVAMILSGRLLAGLRFIDRARRRRQADGCIGMAFYCQLVMGEVHAALAAARPAPVATGPAARLLLRCLRPVARRRALHHLAAAARNRRWGSNSAAQVRIRIARAMLPAGRGVPPARILLSEAHAIAAASGYHGLANAAATALDLRFGTATVQSSPP